MLESGRCRLVRNTWLGNALEEAAVVEMPVLEGLMTYSYVLLSCRNG